MKIDGATIENGAVARLRPFPWRKVGDVIDVPPLLLVRIPSDQIDVVQVGWRYIEGKFSAS